MEDHPAAAPPTPPVEPEPAAPDLPAIAQAPARFWLASAVGVGLAFLVGWLLMPALATVLYVLGLFFFLLAGLLIGAVTYRLALPAAPIPRRRLYALAAIIALTLWSATLVGEYVHLPATAVATVHKTVQRTLKEKLTADELRTIETEVRTSVAAQLDANYAPGGLLGYLRWCLVSGEMKVPRVIAKAGTIPVRVPVSQCRTLWAIRVILSLLFTGGALLSQLLPLAPPRPAPPQAPEPEPAKP